MNLVTQQNAAMVEETTAASRTLFDESTKLARLIRQFRVTARRGRAGDGPQDGRSGLGVRPAASSRRALQDVNGCSRGRSSHAGATTAKRLRRSAADARQGPRIHGKAPRLPSFHVGAIRGVRRARHCLLRAAGENPAPQPIARSRHVSRPLPPPPPP